ncbi:uncharacterized protein LOC109946422 [Prunus persica]|uniref:uncharacterized protein LOC109946422 n=1 Tax=Prunus persica TaxID=3760 RepID=UPI0009AB1F40|nr:uncharacterized protein LOC109946422 [Prunus persica]
MKFQNGKRRIIVKLPDSRSEVPKWFTFCNYFDDYDESKFDYIDHDGRSVRNYKLPIEIPWTSVLENTKLVLCAVWEITESFVSPCSLRFDVSSICRNRFDVSGGETGAGNVWLECISLHGVHDQFEHVVFKGETEWDSHFQGTTLWMEYTPLLLHDQLTSPIFGVTVHGNGLRIKSIGAHLAHIRMSKDGGDDDGKHIDENELDDDGDVGDEVRPRKRTKI